ncbi:CDGSH iron-sulfur domain-containing protein [bacterium]|jgi:CDGSH-type Zn-finger protein|nr:CDGSH iron-sulfur domain-containing protein [bacterium]MBT6778187.1 CDGSH iron-sulfur domain-containing protein [bacterium]
MSLKNSGQTRPHIIKGEKKKYALCACGLSSNQPFCDGSHKSTDITPIIFENEKEGNIALCGCKGTGNSPFCDGSHTKL